MPRFMFVYHGGGMPETPEEGERVMAEWNAWYESMGPAVIHGRLAKVRIAHPEPARLLRGDGPTPPGPFHIAGQHIQRLANGQIGVARADERVASAPGDKLVWVFLRGPAGEGLHE